MRLRVRSGIEREATELLSTAETVPGVKPRCSATDFSVTRASRLGSARLPFMCESPAARIAAFYPAPGAGRIVSQVRRNWHPGNALFSTRGSPDVLENIVIFGLTGARVAEYCSATATPLSSCSDDRFPKRS